MDGSSRSAPRSRWVQDHGSRTTWRPSSRLADKVGFDGNDVFHVSTESDLDEAIMLAPNGAPAEDPTPSVTPEDPDPDGDGLVTVCHSQGSSDQTRQIDVLSLVSHLGHGDTLGECAGGMSCSDPDMEVQICNKPNGNGIWRDRRVECDDVDKHLNHGCLLGTCGANGKPTS